MTTKITSKEVWHHYRHEMYFSDGPIRTIIGEAMCFAFVSIFFTNPIYFLAQNMGFSNIGATMVFLATIGLTYIGFCIWLLIYYLKLARDDYDEQNNG